MVHPNIRPIGDHLLVRRTEQTEQVKGGVIIPDSAKQSSQEATVIALGSGRKGKHGLVTPFEVNVGDTVLLASYGGAEVRLNEEKYTFVREEDILGVLS